MRKTIKQPSSRPVLTITIGTVAATGALLAALMITGPVFRRWVGSPADFDQDYTSIGAFYQVLVVQGISLAVAFLLVGVLVKAWESKSILKWSLWAANPVTVGVGYWLYRSAASIARPWEYFSYADWVLVSLLSPLILVPCASLGARLGRQLTGGRIG
jgi:hypothetical protein